MSYPKSGNTWCRAFLTNLAAPRRDEPASISDLIGPPVASSRDLFDTYLDFDSSDMTIAEIDSFRGRLYERLANEAVAPLVIKLHCAFQLACDEKPIFSRNTGAGAVLIVRNPLDIAVSLSHFINRGLDETIDWMESATSQLNAQTVSCGPTLPESVLSWSDHTQTWLNQAELPLHVVRYEDMVSYPLTAFAAVANFLRMNWDAVAIERAVHFSRFEELQQQEEKHGFRLRQVCGHPFFRNGRVGEWQKVLNKNQTARIIASHGRTMERLGYL